MVGLIDTHTHIFSEEFDADRELVLTRALEAGVERMYMPNVDDTTIKPLLEMCDLHDCCFPLMGLHPTSVDTEWAERLAKVEEVFRSGRKFYGVGEVGLDLYWDKTYLKEQIKVFETQILWALESGLPLIVHCRNAYGELLDIMEQYKDTSLRGIFHCFDGSDEDAANLLQYKNFMLGINGIVTFKKSSLPVVLKDIPIERVVLETDSPYLAPVPYRGKRNESSYLVNVAQKLSEIYGLPLEVIYSITTENALKVFQNAG